jgi:pimeloyl-ACP methyl ester carboxylesterase
MKQLYVKDINANDIKKKADFSSKFIEVQGKQIHYKDEGEGEVIIFLHGIAGSLFIWDKWAKHLTKHYRIIRPDLPSFENAKGSEFSLSYYTDFVQAFTNALDIDRFFLCGHATGGQIAYETAAIIPNRVRALALIAPTGFSKINSSVLSATFRLAFKTFGKEHITWLTSRYLLKKHLRQLYHNSQLVTEELTDKFLNDLLREGNRQSFFKYLQLDNKGIKMKIDEIVTPTLMLWGERDKIIPASDASKFKSLLTTIRLITYPDTGHFPFDEAPKKSCMDLVGFLEDYKNR